MKMTKIRCLLSKHGENLAFTSLKCIEKREISDPQIFFPYYPRIPGISLVHSNINANLAQPNNSQQMLLSVLTKHFFKNH